MKPAHHGLSAALSATDISQQQGNDLSLHVLASSPYCITQRCKAQWLALQTAGRQGLAPGNARAAERLTLASNGS